MAYLQNPIFNHSVGGVDGSSLDGPDSVSSVVVVAFRFSDRWKLPYGSFDFRRPNTTYKLKHRVIKTALDRRGIEMVEAMRAKESLLTQRRVRESMTMKNKTRANLRLELLTSGFEIVVIVSWVVVGVVRLNC